MNEKLELYRLALSEKLFVLSGERFDVRLAPESDEISHAFEIYSREGLRRVTQWYDTSFKLTLDWIDKEVGILWLAIQRDRECNTDAYQLASAAHKRINRLIKELGYDKS